ncbi:hypothetical protein T4B_8216 [Trichinella pseudospiralis]|uniref:Uncharacterized protein n=1 Tax=Trichinella pseudospiralis TaxID=6337 RepID=A0A0V1GQB7_TRIPS|nr:hypothetical protein T4B_8216 [Trichinella pseudospiralis]
MQISFPQKAYVIIKRALSVCFADVMRKRCTLHELFPFK